MIIRGRKNMLRFNSDKKSLKVNPIVFPFRNYCFCSLSRSDNIAGEKQAFLRFAAALRAACGVTWRL